MPRHQDQSYLSEPFIGHWPRSLLTTYRYRGLRVSWHTANHAIIKEGQRSLFNDPERLNGVTVLGVDEHVWRHMRLGDKYVTVVIDLTPVRNDRP